VKLTITFATGDAVTFRFYSYISGQPGVFTPGPTSSVWYPGFTYNNAPAPVCQ